MVEVRPRWERAAELDMTAESLGFTVAALTDGSYVDEFFLEDDKIDIYLYSEVGQDANLDTLARLPLYAGDGKVLPLGAVADITETVSSSVVRRVNGRRTVTLNIIPPRAIPLETGVAQVRTEVVDYMRQRGEIPADVNVAISGAADQLDATREALLGNYLVALLIIYLLMVAIFNHWGYPLLIMTSIPLGIAGGIVGLVGTECCRRPAAAGGPARHRPVLRHDLHAGLPDPDGHGGEQPDPDRAPGGAEC